MLLFVALLWFACSFQLCFCTTSYAIDINCTYKWEINEISHYERIQYSTIWESIHTLLNASSNELTAIQDVTEEQNDAVYQRSSAVLHEGANSTQASHFVMNIEVASETDFVESYVRYLLSDEIITSLQPLPWNIVSVQSTIQIITSKKPEMRGWGIVLLVWIILLFACLAVYVLRKRRKRQKQKVFDTHEYIKKRNDFNPFRDGQYGGYYHLHGRKYEVIPFTLRFDPLTVTGNGCDEFGAYSMEGVYSEKTQRMTLTATYDTNGIHPKKEVKLEYFADVQQFMGTWQYVDADGTGKFVIYHHRDEINPMVHGVYNTLLVPETADSYKVRGNKYIPISNLDIIQEVEE